MLIDFTEEELLVIGKLLGYVAGNKNAYDALDKVTIALEYELGRDDWGTVKFHYEDSDNEVKDFHLYIKVEETV